MTSRTVTRPPLRITTTELTHFAGADSSPADVMTRREREVLDLVTRGYTNREIAGLLSVTMNSVKTYIRVAYRKIDVTTRAEAIRWGLRHGAGC